MAERPAEAPPVDGEQPLEAGAKRAREAAGLVLTGRGEQPRAHHGSGTQRDDQGDHDGDGEGEGEFAEDTPDDPAHQQYGKEYRHQRQTHGQNGKAHLSCAQQGRLESRHAGLDMAGDVLQHHDGIVDDEAGGDRQRHQREIVDAVAQQIHDREGADERDRHRHGRDDGGPRIAQEGEDHEDDQGDGDQQRHLDVVERAADRDRPVVGDGDVDILGDRGLELGQRLLHRIDRRDDIGARLLIEDDQDRGLAVGEPGVAQILDGILDLADIGEPDGRPVAIGDDEAAVLGGVARLVVGIDLVAQIPLLDGALGAVGIGRGKRSAHVFEPDAVFEERVRIELDAHGGKRAAAVIDLADTGKLGDALLQHRGGGVIELAPGEGRGGQRQDQDRRIGGVRFAIGRVAVEIGRQIGAGGIDRRLDIARRAVDIAVEAELEGHPGRAHRGLGGHLADIGDGAEMALQGGGDRRRHDLRARPRHRGLDRDGGEIYLRQRRHRQAEEGDRPGEGQPQGQQRGRHRAADEEFGGS